MEIKRRKPEDIVFESHINALAYYLKLCGLQNTKEVVRKMFLSKYRKGPITPYDISVVLKRNKLDTSVYQLTDFSVLNNFNFPILTFIENKGVAEFLVITKITGNLIYYTNAYGLKETKKKSVFKEMWQGIVIDVKLTKENKSAFKNIKSTQKEAELYKKSLKLINNFITDKECREIINYCNKNDLFKRSEVTNDDASVKNKKVVNNYVSSNRTSHSALIMDNNNKLFLSISDKIQKRMDIKAGQIESFQCVRYGKGAFFSPHYDSNNSLNRKYTLLVYLNDDFEGGETYFPELNKKVKPRKGMAIQFTNFDLKNKNIPYSVHAGLSVLKGVKYAFNIWIKGD